MSVWSHVYKRSNWKMRSFQDTTRIVWKYTKTSRCSTLSFAFLDCVSSSTKSWEGSKVWKRRRLVRNKQLSCWVNTSELNLAMNRSSWSRSWTISTTGTKSDQTHIQMINRRLTLLTSRRYCKQSRVASYWSWRIHKYHWALRNQRIWAASRYPLWLHVKGAFQNRAQWAGLTR